MTARADTDAEHAQAAPDDPQTTLTPEQHHAAAEQLVRQYTLAAMAVALVPLPLVDLAVLVGVQLKMLHGLAGLYGIAFKADLGPSVIAGLIGGTVPTAVSPSLAARLGKFIPGAGHALATGSLTPLAWCRQTRRRRQRRRASSLSTRPPSCIAQL